MIHVYDIGNTAYEKNGDAVLFPTEAKIKMVAGGNWDMTLKHPIDAEGKWSHLVPGAVIKTPVPREEIANAFSGMEADVYKTNDKTALRESNSEPTEIIYTDWSEYNDYNVGSKVTVSGSHHNYECTYFDANSRERRVWPPNSSWWKPIPDKTNGAEILVTLAAGEELYLVEDYDTSWYKMSTPYGIVGYVKKASVTYDRHLTPSETKPRIITEQLTRITNVSVDTKNTTVSVTAQHISYDLNGVIIKEVHLSQASPAMAIGRMTDNFMIDYPGTIATDLSSDDNGTYTDDIKLKSGMYCLLDPDKGIVSVFDAELRRDNWDLFVMTKTTTDRGFRLRYRKNMLGVNWTRKSDSLVNRVVPVAKDEGGADLFLPEVWIDSPTISSYPVIRMEQLTVKGQVGKDKGTGDGSTWTESDLLDEMRTKAGERFSVDKADTIIHEVTVDFAMMGNTAEHPELKGLENVLLYDSVGVIDEDIGLSTTLTVTELEWDAVKEKIMSLKLNNATEKAGRNVTGYNVKAKSIGPDKLTDEVTDGIIEQVTGIIPEYADPEAARPSSNITVYDGLDSTSTTNALSANQGKVLNEKFGGVYFLNFALAANGSKTLSIANSSRALMFTSGPGANRNGMWGISTNTSGTVSKVEMVAASDITMTSATRSITITAANALRVCVMVLAGDIE